MALWPNRSASLLGSAQETDHFARGSCVAFDLAPLASSQRRSLSCSFSAILSRRSVGPHLTSGIPGQNPADEFLSPGVFRLLNLKGLPRVESIPISSRLAGEFATANSTL